MILEIGDLCFCDRKTGVTLVDTGERDEYGMEPVDNLFSSPDKGDGPAKRTNGAANGQYEDPSDEEQDMEIDDGMHHGCPVTKVQCPEINMNLQSLNWAPQPWLA